MKKSCVLILVLLLFSCRNNVEECYHLENYPEGNIKAVECFNYELRLRNRREYFKNGKLAMSFFVNDQNELDGPYFAYHENGNLKTKSKLINGLVEGIQYDYHTSGEIEAITMYKHNKVNGYQVFYHPDGNIRTKFYKVNDSLVYEKRMKVDTIKNVQYFTENYYPIILVASEFVSFNDTIEIKFKLPLPKDTFNLDNMIVNFTCIPFRERTSKKRTIDPDWLIKVPIVDGIATSKVVVQDTGKVELVGFLSQKINGEKIDYDFFSYDLYFQKSNKLK